MLIALFAVTLLYDFYIGVHDAANVVATVISSRAMSPRLALLLTAVAEFAGPFMFGTAIASTLGQGLVVSQAISLSVLLGAVSAAMLWSVATWFLAVPASTSHALVGGLLGAAVMAGGPGVIQSAGLQLVLIALFVSPPLGLLVGFLVMRLTLYLVADSPPRINTRFKRLQILTSVGLAISAGANDAQKAMGVIALGLVIAGRLPAFSVPPWVVAISAGALSLGTAFGGLRLIRTLGGRIYRIRPIHGFTAQIASEAVILGAALLGGPVSTTQVVGSSIMGAGAAERLSKVRWGVAREMLIAWVLTIPVTAGLAALAYLPIRALAL